LAWGAVDGNPVPKFEWLVDDITARQQVHPAATAVSQMVEPGLNGRRFGFSRAGRQDFMALSTLFLRQADGWYQQRAGKCQGHAASDD
jgi:hypothetical protein